MRSIRRISGQFSSVVIKQPSFEGCESYSNCCSQIMTVRDRQAVNETNCEKHVRIDEELPLVYNPRSYTSPSKDDDIYETNKQVHKHPLKQFSVTNISLDIDVKQYVKKQQQLTKCRPLTSLRKKQMSVSSDSELALKKKRNFLRRTKSFETNESKKHSNETSRWNNLKIKLKQLKIKSVSRNKVNQESPIAPTRHTNNNENGPSGKNMFLESRFQDTDGKSHLIRVQSLPII